MNVYVIVSLLTYITLNSGFNLSDPKKKEIALQCATENGANATQLATENIRFRDIFRGRDFKCWRKCYYVRMEYINEKAEANIPMLKERFDVTDDAKLSEIVRACNADNQQDDSCEKIYGIMMCIYKSLKNV